MTAVTIPRPTIGEYPPVFESYLSRVPAGDVFPHLARQLEETLALVSGLSDVQAEFRYAAGKWSIKEILGHLMDTERIFVYRALCFARNEAAPLPGFDENAYVEASNFDARSLSSLIEEFRATRAATVAFFAGLPADVLSRRGTANGREYDVKSAAAIIVGHERHHRAVLAERYLTAARGPA
jgi:uncharacterized damage-inducible protein DinB